jgi:hypothetical protein
MGVDQISKQTKKYFNNHYGGKVVVNALQFEAETRKLQLCLLAAIYAKAHLKSLTFR